MPLHHEEAFPGYEQIFGIFQNNLLETHTSDEVSLLLLFLNPHPCGPVMRCYSAIIYLIKLTNLKDKPLSRQKNE